MTTNFSIVSAVLPFPECHAAAIMQSLTFSDWLPLLRIRLQAPPSLTVVQLMTTSLSHCVSGGFVWPSVLRNILMVGSLLPLPAIPTDSKDVFHHVLTRMVPDNKSAVTLMFVHPPVSGCFYDFTDYEKFGL